MLKANVDILVLTYMECHWGPSKNARLYAAVLPLLLVCGSTFSIITGHKEAAAAVFVEDELTASFILPDAVLIETVEQPRRRTDEQLMLSETNLAKKMKALQCFDCLPMLAQVIYIM